jgi:hypothetical protein
MSHTRKQKPYGSKMEKFDVVGRSRGARNLPINIFISSLAILLSLPRQLYIAINSINLILVYLAFAYNTSSS